MRLGEFVRQYRESHFLSQRQFANRCKLSNAQISLIERGVGTTGEQFSPTGMTLSKLARGMGMSTEELISSVDDFDIDLTDTIEQTPLVQGFMQQLSEYTPDEKMLIQAYRMIPAEHQLEALEAILKIKAKYEN